MRQIAIIGHDPRSAPTSDALQGLEVWGINNPPGWWDTACPGVAFDRIFQIHERFSLSRAEEVCLQDYTGPIYTSWPWDETAVNRVFPLASVLAMPGVPGYMSIRVDVTTQALAAHYPMGGLLTCSFCYALALVCWEGRFQPLQSMAELQLPLEDRIDRVLLYGTELQRGSTRERLVEHGGVLWWSGFAAGLGIQVETPPSSGLLAYPHPYGFRYYEEGDFARRRVIDFEAQCRQEYSEGWWVTYDRGMRERTWKEVEPPRPPDSPR